MLVYSGQPDYLAQYVFGGEHSFVSQSMNAVKSISQVNGDGFGVGWYSEQATPARYRDILPAWADDNLQNICQHIRSHLMFAHIRASTAATATSRSNCHPFAFKQWMFMHNGQVGEYMQVRRQVENMICDQAYCARSGCTDSEAMFLSLFSFDLDADPLQANRQMLQRVQQSMVNANISQPLRYTAALTNGRDIYAIRYASDEEPPTLYFRQSDGNTLISSEPTSADRSSWKLVPANHSLEVKAGVAKLAAFSL